MQSSCPGDHVKDKAHAKQAKRLREVFDTLPPYSDIVETEVPQLDKNSTQGLKVVFESNGKQHPVLFSHKPVGLSFNPGLPLVVTNVSDAALNLGVQAGWEAKSFDEFNIESG